MSTKIIQLTGFKTGSGIELSGTAAVGQMLVVKEVDENGTPTLWEVIDKPSGIEISESAVGQVIMVKAVDENSIPIEYEGLTVVDGNEVLFYGDGNEVAY